MQINSKLPDLAKRHWKWFMDQCGYNNNLYNKWCLTQWSKNFVSNIYKTSLQGMSQTISRYTLSQPTSFPLNIFALNWSPKSSRESLSNNGKETFYLVWNKLKWKRSKCQLFYLPAFWLASFLPAVTDANQIILWRQF